MKEFVNARFWVLGALLLFVSYMSNAAITLQGVSTINSTCANNGTITVYATSSPSPNLLYALVAGPMTTPLQNSNVFLSLFPGTYTIRIYDSNFDSIQAQATVVGHYQLPELNPIDVDPICTGFTNGAIIGNADSSKGLLPFTWELISPTQVGPQPLDTFSNLPSGSYQIRMTDACSNYQTRTVVLNGQGTGLGPFLSATSPQAYIIGCDTVVISHYITLYKEAAYLPLTLTINTVNGPITSQVYATPVDTLNYVPGIYEVRDTFAGLTYADYAHLTVTDVCGVATYGAYQQISPFDFYYEYFVSGTACSNLMGATVRIKTPYLYNYYYTSMKSPVIMTVTDVATNTVVDRDTCSQQYCSTLTIAPQTAGRTYNIHIVDGCGHVYQQNIVWPTPAAPTCQVGSSSGCLDSTAVAYFNCHNFRSRITITILSGPPSVGSSKPGYEHRANITYPQVYTNMKPGGIALRDLAAGSYTYTVSDSCGNTVNGSFTVTPANLAGFHYDYSIKRGCLGTNTLYFNAYQQAVALWVKDSVGNYIYQRVNYLAGRDSINSVPPGRYTLEIYYGNSPYGGGVFDTTVVPANTGCWVLRDTITVYPYSNNTFKSNTTIFCNGLTYVELNVDSTRGVPPYLYEISSGPQTFPLQTSNTFQVSALGTYVIRIRDSCANTSVQEISLRSDTFPPIIKKGIMCLNSRVVLGGIPSAYFDYEWERPNGTKYLGDSLIIDPLTVADTGLYQLTQYVHINGCTDTFVNTYYVSFTDSFPQSVRLCQGDTLFVGTAAYTADGRYVDTLISQMGCDSIIITDLLVLNQTTVTIDTSICMGQRVVVNGHTYGTTGSYRDSIVNGSCYQIIVTNLTVNGSIDTVTASLCLGDTFFVGSKVYTQTGIYRDTLASSSGCDSVIVADLVFNYSSYAALYTICQGDSVMAAGHAHYTNGVHFDTLPSSIGCDSVVITIINFLPSPRDTIRAQICAGDSYMFGAGVYTNSGVYYDTLPTSGCDSIVVLDLTVTPYLRDTVAGAICPGGSYSFAGNNYTAAGIYTDTVVGSSCDSIITLVITQLDYVRDTLNATICPGSSYSFHGNSYAAAGTYMDTVSGPGCDSIVTLNLTISSYLRDTVLGAVCPGGIFTYGGNSYNAAGTYTDTVIGSSCDSIITLVITQLNYLQDTINATICPSSSYSFYGNSYSVAGSYMDTVSGPGCDSIIILNLSVSAYITHTVSQTICAGDRVVVGSHTYSQTGVYTDTLASSICDSIVTLNLTVLPLSASAIARSICEGDSLAFGGQYLLQAGTYTDTLSTVNGCDSIVTLTLTMDATPGANIIANATEVYVGDTVLLNTTAITVLSYNWTSLAQINNPTIQHPTAVISEPVWIYMDASWDNNSCTTTDSIFIDLLPEPSDCDGNTYLHIPNVFSPNNDGNNDEFVIFHKGINLIELKIFNRWGELVYRTKDIDDYWDGTYKGVAVAPDVYVYYLTYLPCDGHYELYKEGSITVVK